MNAIQNLRFVSKAARECLFKRNLNDEVFQTETLVCDVGELELPSYDLVMRPWILEYGSWEIEEAVQLRGLVKLGDLVVNVGANVGYTSLLLSQLVGNLGSVIAVEPEPLNVSLLDRNLTRNRVSNVLVLNTACGDANGSIKLHLSPDNSGDHRTTSNPGSIEFAIVRCLTVDKLMARRNKVSGLVIDAQGYDHRIIRGAKRTIRRSCRFVMAEFWPKGILLAGDDPSEVFEFYRSRFSRVIDVPSNTDLGDLEWNQVLEVVTSNNDHSTLLMLA